MGHGMDSGQLQLQLQSHLHHDPASVNEDLDRACRNARSCDLQSQGAMHWVLQSPRFKHWIQSPAPDALVVDGNLADGMARYSATSLLCGMIIQSLVKQKAIHVLSFFCGSHNSRSDPLSGPGGLLRSLISQLLSIQQYDVGFLKFGQWIEGPLINEGPSVVCSAGFSNNCPTQLYSASLTDSRFLRTRRGLGNCSWF
jgi:hypothetical protein